MSKTPKLNLSMFTDEQREEFIKELDGSEVFITSNTIKAFSADGQEVPAHLDMIGHVIRLENQPGYYRVSSEPDDEPSAQINATEIYQARRPAA